MAGKAKHGTQNQGDTGETPKRREREKMKLYKLTNERGQTRDETQWGEGVTHSGTGKGELCGPGWIHAYTHPLLAVLLNPIHADFQNPQLWEAQGKIGKNDYGLKVGCRRLTTTKRISLPIITPTQRVMFAILCVKEVCKDEKWNVWADNWMSGNDRSAAASRTAERAARVATEAAMTATAEGGLARADLALAEAAMWAATEAATEAAAVGAATAAEGGLARADLALAEAAMWAATEAATEAAAVAAAVAAATGSKINFIAIAKKALKATPGWKFPYKPLAPC
jgi:hypothetical protein